MTDGEDDKIVDFLDGQSMDMGDSAMLMDGDGGEESADGLPDGELSGEDYGIDMDMDVSHQDALVEIYVSSGERMGRECRESLA